MPDITQTRSFQIQQKNKEGEIITPLKLEVSSDPCKIYPVVINDDSTNSKLLLEKETAIKLAKLILWQTGEAIADFDIDREIGSVVEAQQVLL